jgi:predicted dinucleotide-binding enzyme
MSTIAILGAGGKMGCRLTDNLVQHNHKLLLVEVSDAGLANIAKRGLSPTPQPEALARAEVVILALPDRLMSKIAHEVVPQLKAGTLVITLDPAVAHAGGLPPRPDVSFQDLHRDRPGRHHGGT